MGQLCKEAMDLKDGVESDGNSGRRSVRRSSAALNRLMLATI